MEGGVWVWLMVWVRKKIKKRAAGPTQGRAEKKEDQDMGVIASGCRIAWHMGPFGGVSGTAQGCTVSHTPFVLAPGQLRHLKGTTHSCSSFAQYERARGGKGEGGEKQPPQGCHPPKPVRASRASNPPGNPRLGSYRSTRSALGTALFAKTCRTSTR